MEIKEYQEKAQRTLNTESSQKDTITNMCLGISGETGEVIDMIKKHIFHGHEIDTYKLEKEIGDVMWYLTNLATQFNLNMSHVLDTNIKKLENRYPEGFSKERSINRKE